MGCHINITADRYPGQGARLGRKVKVCYHYDTSKRHNGVIVRDDAEEPYVSIIKTDDGRYLLTTECQYSLK